MGRLTALCLLIFAPAIAAQEWPEGWEVRLDRPDGDASGVAFVTMDPGWHITTGPAAVLYDTENTATGDFEASADIFLFDPEGRREAFGLFVGGSDLQGDAQAYTYFLLRDGGEFLVKQRSGSETSTVTDWTADPAIRSFADREEDGSSVLNTLGVRVAGGQVHFLVNGTEVASVPSAGLALDGIVGLRVNHRLNLHVSGLEIAGAGGDR